jgi:poly-gamma-glutamate capsule biosynthesis protein CapA/YwtB (metallophosphatase superfamily)
MTSLDLMFAGDLVLDEPDPDHWLSGIAPALRAADIAIAHLEVPHTRRGKELRGDVPAPGADPAFVPAIARAGITAVSLAGNHMADCGAEGISDTRDALTSAGISFAGAGANLAAARAPALLERQGRRIALLSYNCVGPQNSWASPDHAGCAFVRVETLDGAPIAPSAQLDHANAESVAAMSADVTSARNVADLVIIALHKGIVHTPARLAPYERPIAHAAIDAGADIVLGHHAHIVRGIELYRGKPIFHGLGNGCVVTRALSPDQSHPERAAWARKRRELFGFEPDAAYYLAPFHPEAVNAMLGRVQVNGDGRLRTGFIPVHVEPPGRPELATSSQRASISKYIERITVAAGLPAISTTLDGECAWLN